MNDKSISLCQQKNQANEHREVCPGVSIKYLMSCWCLVMSRSKTFIF